MRFCPPKPPFSGFPSTKSGFLCFFWLWNPCFRLFRAQNRLFCALLPARFFPMLPHCLPCRVSREEFPTPLEMSLHGLPLLRHSKSFGPSAQIAYATCVSPPDEAAAWPGVGVRWQMRLPHRGERTEGNSTVGARYLERTTWGRATRERAVRRILFAGFEALCVFGYLELVYHLLNLTIHKDRQVVG